MNGERGRQTESEWRTRERERVNGERGEEIESEWRKRGRDRE